MYTIRAYLEGLYVGYSRYQLHPIYKYCNWLIRVSEDCSNIGNVIATIRISILRAHIINMSKPSNYGETAAYYQNSCENVGTLLYICTRCCVPGHVVCTWPRCCTCGHVAVHVGTLLYTWERWCPPGNVSIHLETISQSWQTFPVSIYMIGSLI